MYSRSCFKCVVFQGVNLSSAVQNGQVTYLDGLRLVSEALDEGGQEHSTDHCTAGNVADDFNPFTNVRLASQLYKIYIQCMLAFL